MNSNGFEKFYGYRKNTVWIKIFLFAYVYVGIFGIAAYLLTRLSGTETIVNISKTLTGQGITYDFLHGVVTLLLIATFVGCGVFLPLIDMKGYWSTMVNLWAIIAYEPVLFLLKLITDKELGTGFIIGCVIVFVISSAFAVVNFVYFSERRDLFEQSINEIIMGEPKDELKH